MAVLAGIAGVRLVALLDGTRLAAGARTVATMLRLARGTALAADATTEVRFDVARRVCETRDARGTVVETRSLPPGVGFGALPARARVLFGGTGTADNATITLVSGRGSRRIVVNQRGRVRLQ